MLIRECFLEESRASCQEDTVCFLLVLSDTDHSMSQARVGKTTQALYARLTHTFSQIALQQAHLLTPFYR